MIWLGTRRNADSLAEEGHSVITQKQEPATVGPDDSARNIRVVPLNLIDNAERFPLGVSMKSALRRQRCVSTNPYTATIDAP
jgi:hypothetical protein